MKPLVTEKPEGNYQNLHNMTGIDANMEVYLRDYNGEGDLNLVDYCKRECKAKCNIDKEGTAEDFADYMDCDCPVSLVYHMAVGHAELRSRLGKYESFGLSPDELKDRTCEWLEKEDFWECSKCDAAWTLTSGSPKDNHMSYCPQCGRKIVKVSPYQEEPTEDEE